MFWVESIYCRTMAKLGYLPQPNHWAWDTPQGLKMNGYRIPLSDQDILARNLDDYGIKYRIGG